MDQNLNKTYSYSKDHVEIISTFIEPDFVEFIQDYISIKINSNQYDINQENFIYGYKFYSDSLIETILQNSCESIFGLTGVKIVPTYSLTQMYMKDDEYINDINESCEISAILFLGCSEENPPIYIKNTSINLFPGDLLIYDSHRIKPYRKTIENKWLLESTLNYVNSEGPYKDNIYDKRPYLGFIKSTENIITK